MFEKKHKVVVGWEAEQIIWRVCVCLQLRLWQQSGQVWHLILPAEKHHPTCPLDHWAKVNMGLFSQTSLLKPHSIRRRVDIACLHGVICKKDKYRVGGKVSSLGHLTTHDRMLCLVDILRHGFYPHVLLLAECPLARHICRTALHLASLGVPSQMSFSWTW